MEAGDDPWSSEAPFDRCRWFWRGWTLQELLAPDHVEFFNCDWQRLGSKRDLSSVISRATGINKRVLRGEVSIDSTSIAQRMSWAAGRKTRRPEDRSYCLMGLFQINMVMLYGEGAVKAFLRLQEEIMRSTSDPTLFAFHGCPDAFDYEGASKVVCHKRGVGGHHSRFGFTHRGLEITLDIKPDPSFLEAEQVYMALLNIPHPVTKADSMAIRLHKPDPRSNEHWRVDCDQLFSERRSGDLVVPQPILVPQPVPVRSRSRGSVNFHLRVLTRHTGSFEVLFQADTLDFRLSSEEYIPDQPRPSERRHQKASIKARIVFNERGQLASAVYVSTGHGAFVAVLGCSLYLEPIYAVVRVSDAESASPMVRDCFLKALASGSYVQPEDNWIRVKASMSKEEHVKRHTFCIMLPTHEFSFNARHGTEQDGRVVVSGPYPDSSS